MAQQLVLGRRWRSPLGNLTSNLLEHYFSYCCTATCVPGQGQQGRKDKGKWLTLPPFKSSIDVSVIGKRIVRGQTSSGESEPTTALKWVRRCCPQLPDSLVYKLFRLRQVRREVIHSNTACCVETQALQPTLRRVSAKDSMSSGDVIFLPITVQEYNQDKHDHHQSEDEINYFRSFELYKDPAIIIINKPPGMPVQGGIGIKLSVDMLAATSLRYDYSEPPRLVHRLDRDTSGILVLARTQITASILHSIFREKTFEACDNVEISKRILQKKYWALVIGTPKHSRGVVSAPLTKVVLENGKSEQIMIADSAKMASSQHAFTEYKVLGSSAHGFTWLELCPLTGRKHQLRVHCAEALGTPIVGDYKYGWQGHRNWKPETLPDPIKESGGENLCNPNAPFGCGLKGGSISEKRPRLHLHCTQMILPDVSAALQHLQSSSDYDISKLERLDVVAPLPSHMKRSWDILGY